MTDTSQTATKPAAVKLVDVKKFFTPCSPQEIRDLGKTHAVELKALLGALVAKGDYSL